MVKFTQQMFFAQFQIFFCKNFWRWWKKKELKFVKYEYVEKANAKELRT